MGLIRLKSRQHQPASRGEFTSLLICVVGRIQVLEAWDCSQLLEAAPSLGP